MFYCVRKEIHSACLLDFQDTDSVFVYKKTPQSAFHFSEIRELQHLNFAAMLCSVIWQVGLQLMIIFIID